MIGYILILGCTILNLAEGILIKKYNQKHAKGGFIFSLSQELSLPVIFAGVGEKMDDLEKFDSRTFVEAIL